MKFFDLKNREIINVNTGEKLGLLSHCDLDIEIETGKIIKLLVPETNNFFPFFSESKYIEIPWENVKKIGVDTIMVSI